MKVISKQVRQVFFHLAHATCRKSQKMHWNTLFLPRFLNQNVHVCRTCAPTCILYLATCPEVEEEVCVWFARRAGQCACAWKRINLMVRLADYVAAGVSSFGSHATFSVNPARSNHKWQGHVFLICFVILRVRCAADAGWNAGLPCAVEVASSSTHLEPCSCVWPAGKDRNVLPEKQAASNGA